MNIFFIQIYSIHFHKTSFFFIVPFLFCSVLFWKSIQTHRNDLSGNIVVNYNCTVVFDFLLTRLLVIVRYSHCKHTIQSKQTLMSLAPVILLSFLWRIDNYIVCATIHGLFLNTFIGRGIKKTRRYFASGYNGDSANGILKTLFSL